MKRDIFYDKFQTTKFEVTLLGNHILILGVINIYNICTTRTTFIFHNKHHMSLLKSKKKEKNRTSWNTEKENNKL